MNGTIAAVMAALVAVLAAIGLLTGKEAKKEEPSSPRAAAVAGPSIATIAGRVERVRELRFKRLPPARRVTSSQARAEALKELDSQIPPHDVAGEEELHPAPSAPPRAPGSRSRASPAAAA